MVRKWYKIAKAEYLISTAELRGNRLRNVGALFIFGILWAILLAPFIIETFIGMLLPIEYFRLIIITLLPGIIRSAMFFVWIILLIIPLSRALVELRIGQWEIFLSNNVKTRDILVGSFLGKIPLYLLLVLYVAPPFLSVLFLAFEVAFLGQILIYSVLFAMILSVIWLSNLITAAIQAKLGESARGKDIANGLAILLAIVTIVPIYGIMFYTQQLTMILGMNVFLFFPFTWVADSISWLTIRFSQISFSVEQFLLFHQTLPFDLVLSVVLFSVFGIFCVSIGLLAADRIFTYNIGARTEQISTVTSENLFYRGIRKVASGSFGALVITCMKDFFRRASNLSKIAYGVILAVILPIVMSQVMIVTGDASGIDMMMLIMVGGIGLGLIGSYTFSGTAFMESKDQLWIIQSTPSGTSRFIKARIVSALITAMPLCIIPSMVLTFLAAAGIETLLFLLLYGGLIVCGAILFGTGITAWNPYYENTKSAEHQMNVIITTMGVQFAIFAPIMISIIGDIFGLPFWDMIRNTVGSVGMPYAFALISIVSLFIVGSGALLIGSKRLSRPQV